MNALKQFEKRVMYVVLEILTLVAQTPQSFVTKDDPCAVRSRSVSFSNIALLAASCILMAKSCPVCRLLYNKTFKPRYTQQKIRVKIKNPCANFSGSTLEF